MGVIQKIALGVIGIAFATTVLLPGRQTVPVLDALTNLSTGTLRQAEGLS